MSDAHTNTDDVMLGIVALHRRVDWLCGVAEYFLILAVVGLLWYAVKVRTQ